MIRSGMVRTMIIELGVCALGANAVLMMGTFLDVIRLYHATYFRVFHSSYDAYDARLHWTLMAR